jgi:peptide/nickel transport system substrate-binding protein
MAAVDETAGRYGGTIVVGFAIGFPKGFNTNVIKEFGAEYMMVNVMGKLVLTNSLTGEIYPWLAKNWEISADNTVYTFHLVDNVTWQDGQPFTAYDVNYTLNFLMTGNVRVSPKLYYISRVDAPDKNTLVVTLKEPNALFLTELGFLIDGYYEAYPEHLYAGTDWLTNPYNLQPVGTGPFKIVEVKSPDYVILKRNENYFRSDHPHADKLIIRYFPDVPSAIHALEVGDIDFYNGEISYAEMVRLTANPDMITKASYCNIHSICFNLRKAPFNDVRVRQAIGYAVNRDEVLDRLGYPTYPMKKLTGTFFPNPSWSYNPNAQTPAFNSTEAERLLDAAGYPRGLDGKRLSVELLYAEWSVWSDAVQVLKTQLASVGVDVVLNKIEWATLIARMTAGQFDFALQGPAMLPDPHKHTLLAYSTGARNFMGYNNSRVDELFDQGLRTVDQNTRKQYYYEIQEILAQDLPFIPLWSAPSVTIYRRGWHDTPQDEGVPTSKINEAGYEFTWHEAWNVHSPKEAIVVYMDSVSQVDKFESRGFDVSAARTRLSRALEAYNASRYDDAVSLAEEAPALAVPPGGTAGEIPLWIYGVIGALGGAVIVLGGALFVFRRKKSK